MLRELSSDNAIDRLRYHTDLKTRRLYEKRIYDYLKDMLLCNPDEFDRRYYRWEYHDEMARKMLPKVLNLYYQVTGKAIMGQYDVNKLEPHVIETMLDNVLYSSNLTADSEILHISILGKRLLTFPNYRKHRVVACISFPTQSLRRLSGSLNYFIAETDTMDIEFTEKIVKVLIHKN